MSRPSDVSSKTVSVRIPMDKYIDLLNEAFSHKLSISELLTLKLFPSVPNEEEEVVKEAKKEKKKEEEDKKPKVKRGKLVNSGSKFYVSALNNYRDFGFSSYDLTGIRIGDVILSKSGTHLMEYPEKGKLQIWEVKE